MSFYFVEKCVYIHLSSEKFTFNQRLGVCHARDKLSVQAKQIRSPIKIIACTVGMSFYFVEKSRLNERLGVCHARDKLLVQAK